MNSVESEEKFPGGHAKLIYRLERNFKVVKFLEKRDCAGKNIVQSYYMLWNNFPGGHGDFVRMQIKNTVERV